MPRVKSRLAASADALSNPTRPADVQTVTEEVDRSVAVTRQRAGSLGPGPVRLACTVASAGW